MPAPQKLTSSNHANRRQLASECLVNDALTRIGARWKMQVLYFIEHGTDTFGALKRSLPGVSDHMLATRLRELTAEGLADKRPDAAGRHAYLVTARGRDLLAIIAALCDWARAGP